MHTSWGNGHIFYMSDQARYIVLRFWKSKWNHPLEYTCYSLVECIHCKCKMKDLSELSSVVSQIYSPENEKPGIM